MSKFKIGDKVVCINSDGLYNEDVYQGSVHIITGAWYGKNYGLLYSKEFCGAFDHRFELLKDLDNTPSDLEEALAKIDSLEELVAELSQELKEAKDNDRSIRYKSALYDQLVVLVSSHKSTESVYRGQHGEEVITDTIKLLQKSYDERTTLIAAVKTLQSIITENFTSLDSTDYDALCITHSTLKDILKPELE